MFKRLLVIAVLGTMLSGCYMVPMALVGPGISGFSTASLIQSGVTTGANYVVQKSTGKSIAEHAIASLSKDILQQTYFPSNGSISSNIKASKSCKISNSYCGRISRQNSHNIKLAK